MMIIDAHTHIFSKSVTMRKEDYLSDPCFNLLYSCEKAKIKTADDIRCYIDKEKLDAVWTMGFCWRDGYQCSKENDSILKEISVLAEKIIPFAGVPSYPQADIKKTIRKYASQGFKGIGEVAFYCQQWDDSIESYCLQIFEAAAEENLAVCFHLNEPVGHQYPGKYASDFHKVYSLIRDFPTLHMILAHLGGGILFYEMMPEVKAAFSNVYYDTAAVPFLYDPVVYLRACEIAGKEKIIFGSDYPLLDIDRYKEAICSCLAQDDADFVFGLNAARIISVQKR